MRYLVLALFVFYCSDDAFSQMVDEATPSEAQPANTNIGGEWVLDFSDEFNGSAVNISKWTIDNSTKSRAARPSIGISDWRWKPDNVAVEDGNLLLKVYKIGSNSMTNGSINSHGQYTTTYGYFEARINVAEAHKGTHTAFWLQGPGMSNVDGTANDGAEIDIFETAWTGDYTKSVVHIDGYGVNHQANTKQYNTPGIHSGFHVWGFHWTENFMDIYYDGVFKVRYSNSKWVVRSPEFLWLSDGASFGLSGDQYFLDFPEGYLTEAQVDYMRVWKLEGEGEVNDSLLIQDAWELVSADSEDTESGNDAVNAFDDASYTIWHTEWVNSQPVHPHEIVIDLGDSARIYGFKYLPRQDESSNGNIFQYEFYTSENGLDWGEEVVSGSFSDDKMAKTSFFSDTVSCRYVKLVALSSFDDAPFTSVAELDLYGYYSGEGTGIWDLDERRAEGLFEVFPNPFQEEINVRYGGEGSSYAWRVFTIDGRAVRAGKFAELTCEEVISLSGFKAGTYIFEIISDKQKATKLLFKKES